MSRIYNLIGELTAATVFLFSRIVDSASSLTSWTGR